MFEKIKEQFLNQLKEIENKLPKEMKEKLEEEKKIFKQEGSFFFILTVIYTIFVVSGIFIFQKINLLPGGKVEDLIQQVYFFERFGLVGFQTPKSENMASLITTHNQIFGYCVFVVLFVFFFLVVTLVYYGITNEEKKGEYPYQKIENRMERLSSLYEGIKISKEELYFYDSYERIVDSEGTFFDRVPLEKDFISFQKMNSLKGEEVYRRASIFSRVLKGLKLKSQVVRQSRLEKARKGKKLLYEVENETIVKTLKRDQSSRSRRKFWDNLVVETVWTLVPSFILIAIAVPSFFFLYSLSPDIFYDENTVFLKVIGHQWYWSYEFPNESFALLQKPVEQSFSSYMLPTSELKEGMPRLLSVDNPVYLPTKTNIVIRVTSEDVIHSWAVPSLGVKLDCIPGRINEFLFVIDRPGTLYGQCSELCGVNHGFMPIQLIAYDNAEV